jgi:hypothetical protein
MISRRFTLAWLASGLALPAFAQSAPAPAPSATAVPDPVATVRRAYDPKVKEAQRPYSRRLRRHYDAAIKTSRRLNEPVSGLDFDPMTNSQDADDNFRESLRYAVKSQTADKAVVEVKLRVFKDQPELTLLYELVIENKAWRINDIVSPATTDGWRLSSLLEAGAKGQ